MTNKQITEFTKLYSERTIENLEKYCIEHNVVYIKRFLSMELKNVEKYLETHPIETCEKEKEPKEKEPKKIEEYEKYRIAYTKADIKQKEDIANVIKRTFIIKREINPIKFNNEMKTIDNIHIINPQEIFDIKDEKAIKIAFYCNRYYIFYNTKEHSFFMNLENIISIVYDLHSVDKCINKILELTGNKDFEDIQVIKLIEKMDDNYKKIDNCCKQLQKIMKNDITTHLNTLQVNAYNTKQITLDNKVFVFATYRDLSSLANNSVNKAKIVMFYLLATGYLIKVDEKEVDENLVKMLNRNNKFNNVNLYRVNLDFDPKEADRIYDELKKGGFKQNLLSEQFIKDKFPALANRIY